MSSAPVVVSTGTTIKPLSVLQCTATTPSTRSEGSFITTLRGRYPLRPTFTLADLDLTVDYDSDVEDSLDTDLWKEGVIWDPKQLAPYHGQFAGNYRKQRYRSEVSTWKPSEIERVLFRLHKYGLLSWFAHYALGGRCSIRKLLFALGVLLMDEQLKLDNKSLLPLVKAAAFRSLRRSKKSLSVPRSLGEFERVALDVVARRIRMSKKIIVLTGAGISVSCGIPDFRSRNGLYSQLFSSGAYDLDDPQQMFDINYFKKNPTVFYSFAHKIYPSNFTPSHCHRFIKALERHEKLSRNYTQNIDGLEAKAGVVNVFQCHGSFATARCVNCNIQVPGEEIRDDLLARRVPLCKSCNPDVDSAPKKVQRKKKRKKRNDGWESDELDELAPELPPGIMKPDITFFGEKLSTEFDRMFFKDVKRVDLLIVIGTSLKVRPVSEIITHMPRRIETIVINKVPLPHCYPDYQLLGDADVIVQHLARKLGWSLDPAYDCKSDAVTGQTTSITPLTRPVRPVRMKETGRSKTNVTIVGRSGVLLFKGAEGGRYVDDLIADRKSRKSDDIDAVVDADLSDLSESESEPDSLHDKGRTNKRQRMSL